MKELQMTSGPDAVSPKLVVTIKSHQSVIMNDFRTNQIRCWKLEAEVFYFGFFF